MIWTYPLPTRYEPMYLKQHFHWYDFNRITSEKNVCGYSYFNMSHCIEQLTTLALIRIRTLSTKTYINTAPQNNTRYCVIYWYEFLNTCHEDVSEHSSFNSSFCVFAKRCLGPPPEGPLHTCSVRFWKSPSFRGSTPHILCPKYSSKKIKLGEHLKGKQGGKHLMGGEVTIPDMTRPLTRGLITPITMR